MHTTSSLLKGSKQLPKWTIRTDPSIVLPTREGSHDTAASISIGKCLASIQYSDIVGVHATFIPIVWDSYAFLVRCPPQPFQSIVVSSLVYWCNLCGTTISLQQNVFLFVCSNNPILCCLPFDNSRSRTTVHSDVQ